HICDLVPVYLPGGRTAGVGGAATIEPALHIRDVLYNEANRPDNYPGTIPNPTPPQPQWQVLTGSDGHAGVPRDWYTRTGYNCQGTGGPTGTACDEWPWFGTEQGGPGAHLRILSFQQNSASGADWQAFM